MLSSLLACFAVALALLAVLALLAGLAKLANCACSVARLLAMLALLDLLAVLDVFDASFSCLLTFACLLALLCSFARSLPCLLECIRICVPKTRIPLHMYTYTPQPYSLENYTFKPLHPR